MSVLPFPSAPRHDQGVTPSTDTTKLREVVGDVLRDERRQQERTLTDVAERAAVSVAYLSELERGRKDASSDVIAAVCGALDLPLPALLDRAARRLTASARATSSAFALAA